MTPKGAPRVPRGYRLAPKARVVRKDDMVFALGAWHPVDPKCAGMKYHRSYRYEGHGIARRVPPGRAKSPARGRRG